MTKQFCDRCGSEKQYDIMDGWVSFHFIYEDKTDLCPTCYQLLVEWMKGTDVE